MGAVRLKWRVTQPLLGDLRYTQWVKAILQMDRPRGSKIWSGIILQGQAIPRATTALNLPNHTPHKPHNLVIQEGNLQLHDRTGQGRALPRENLNNAADRDIWSGWNWSQRDGHHRYTCSMRQYSASRCNEPTELYMVCPWKREGLYLQLTCVSWTKRIYTQLYVIPKCMELCVYIYISDKWWNVALLRIYLAATSSPSVTNPLIFSSHQRICLDLFKPFGFSHNSSVSYLPQSLFISSHYHL